MNDKRKNKAQLLEELRELREHEEHFRTLCDDLGDASYRADTHGRITYVNRVGEELAGLPLKDIVGQPFLPLFTQDSRSIALDAYQRTLAGQSPEYELTFAATGKTCQFKNKPVRDGSGKVVGLIGVARDITERKRADEALRQREEQLAAVVDCMTDHMSMIDEEHNILWANTTAKRMFGSSLIGRKCYQAYHRRDKACEACVVSKTFADGRIHEHETEVIGADGARMVFWCTATVASRHEDGRPKVVIETSRNITERKRAEEALRQAHDTLETRVKQRTAELAAANTKLQEELTKRKQAEQALRESEETVRALLNATTDVVLLIDADGTTLAANEAVARRLGRSIDELVGRCVYDFFPPDVAEIRQAKAEEVFSSGKPVPYLDQRAGRYFECMVYPLFDAKGNVDRIAVFARDVTEHKRAEEALRESEERYRVLFEQAPDSIVLVDKEKGTLVEFNDRACEHLGYTRAEFQDLRVADLEVIESHEQVLEHAARIVDEGGDTFETRQKTKTGEIRDVLVISQGISIGGRQGALGIWHDISERKRVEEALRESEDQLRLITDSLPVLISYVDSEQRYRFNNKPYEEWFGVSRTAAAGRHLSEVLGDQVYQRIRPYVEAALCGREVTFENEVPYKGAGTRYVSAMYVPHFDRNAQVRGFFALIEDITERKRDEAALRESEELFRTVVDASKDAMVAINAEGLVTIFNPAAEAMFGRRNEDVIDQPLDCLMPEEYRTFHQEYVKSYFTTGSPHNAIGKIIELPALRSDGEVFPIELSLSMGWRGGERFVLAVIRDITKRKRAEEALERSEARFRGLVETTSDWVWEVDRSGVYTYASPQVSNLLGYAPEDVVGKTPFDFMPSDEAERAGKWFADITKSRKSFAALENTNLHRDGRRVVLETSGVPILDVGGELLGYRGIDRDITERKRVEEALRESEERYRTLVESVADGVGLVVGGKISYANPALCAMLGRTAQEIQGRSPEEFHIPEQRLPTAERIRAVLAGAHVPLAKSTYLRPDGSHVEIEITSTRIRWAGRPALLSVIRDVTQRQRAEEEKASLKEQLYQAQKMQAVGHVAAGIAHDFGSLLGVMRGGIRRLRAESAPDDAMRERLNLIEKAEQEATGVTQSLLMFSRRLPTERKPVELGQLIKESEPILRHLLPRAVELHVDTGCERGVWASRPQPSWVKADRTQLQQILLNLVINARDALPGGGTVEITVTTAGDDSRDSAATKPSSTPPAVRLAVHDTGVGIPPDVRPHIFEPFFTTRPAGRGTGLGLATVQSITRDHGGRIEVETTVGRGSTFTIVLPGILAELTATAPPVPAGRGEVVLLEESNRHIRRLITSTLRSWNYEVVLPAEDGSAFESLQQQTERVALLILDTDPPAHDRCECLRRIRAAGHRTPIILTVQAPDPEIDDLLDDSTVVLHKPFQMSELGACLSELLASQPRIEPRPRTEPRP